MTHLPSINNKNPLTWKCKIFGCKDDTLPLSWYDSKEEHGIKGNGKFTAATLSVLYEFRGCMWCANFRKIFVKIND